MSKATRLLPSFLFFKMFIQFKLFIFLVTLSRNAIQADNNPDISAISFDRRVLFDHSDSSDVFNKTLASKHGKTFNLLGARSARTPPTLAYPSHPTLPPPTSPTGREMPSYSPPNRAFFTPPLPPEYLNPFAEKPTLRDSNSDSASVSNKRPIPPPPPRLPSEIELIPIRPPDLPVQDTRKKTLNTPSFKKLAEIPYSETTSTTTTNSRSVNESFDFVPILPYPSVSRILSGGSGRKHDILQDILERPRFESESKASRTIKQELGIVKTLIPPSVKPPQVTERKPQATYPKQEISTQSSRSLPTRPPEITEEELRIEVTEPPLAARDPPEVAHMPELPEPRQRQVLGVAWDIHVYLIATLFAILAICSLFNIIRISSFKRLLTRGYFLTLHGILLIIGTSRSVYLFYDAYNINHSLPEPISHLLLNVIFPLLTSSFAILFLFLLLAGEVKMVNHKLQRASVLALFIIAHLILSVSVDLCANTTPFSTLLPVICQCLFVILCVALGLSYLYLYKSLSHSSLRKQGNIFGSAFSDSHRPTLAHAVRVTLATAMLSLLMAAVQLYGMFGVYEFLGEESPHLWLWWGYQFSVRVIEISMCFLMSWAGVQPLRCEAEKETQSHNSSTGFALFSCGAATPRGSEGGPGDDMYPAICSSNQAIHNYSLRTGKQVYDDTFPLNNLHTGPHMFLHNTTERRSLKKHPVEDHELSKSICGTLVPYDRRLQPSPSMLVAENGFVRFRSLADGEQPEDSFTQPNIGHPREDFT
ncbi:uncharacterized protein LOC124360564 [Homalodisca vitripennis]|nr:uncharacterized protein LOC124360564 [Homalodisca vitripennis]KAG8336018.1 hypothetical protein J6590_054067 [Homalodisca vitripennis]